MDMRKAHVGVFLLSVLLLLYGEEEHATTWKLETLDAAACLADDYSLTHKISFAGKPHQSFSFGRQNGLRSTGPSRNPGKQDPQKQNLDEETLSSPKFIPPAQKSKSEVTNKPFNSVICNYCKKRWSLIVRLLQIKKKTAGSK